MAAPVRFADAAAARLLGEEDVVDVIAADGLGGGAVIAAEVGSRVDNPPGSGRVRVQFVASQLVGVVMARYILELDPFRSLPVDQIAKTIGPNLQRYLTDDLPGLPKV